MNDRPEVGCLFPGCMGVDILNDLDSIWMVKMSLGPFSRTIEIHAHTTEIIENQKLAWTAAHEHLITSGSASFRKISDNETELTYRLEGHVTGRLGFLQEIIVAEKLGEVTRAFMKNIKERLEDGADNKSKEL